MKKIKIWSPANDGSSLSKENVENGLRNTKEYGFIVDIDQNFALRKSKLGITSIQDRIYELKQAFQLEKGSILMSLYGGYSTNLLLSYVHLFKNNSHIILSGKSDLTCLQNALYSYLGIKSIYGIDFSKLSNPYLSQVEKEVIKKTLNLDTVLISKPQSYNDGFWYINSPINYRKKSWFTYHLSEDSFHGVTLGGNLESLLTLSGTNYMPNFKDRIVVLESMPNISPGKLIMQLQTIMMTTDILKSKLLILGSFSPTSILSEENIIGMMIKELRLKLPIIANVDISHTEPSYPFYIGGHMDLDVEKEIYQISW